MHPNIKHLIELQIIDLRLNELRALLAGLPRRLAEVDGRVAETFSGIRVVRLQNIGIGRFLDDNNAFIRRNTLLSCRSTSADPEMCSLARWATPTLARAFSQTF